MRIFSTFITLGLLTACITSTDNVTPQSTITGNTSYSQALEKAHQKAEIITNFETRHMVGATLVSGPFLENLKSRYQEILGHTNVGLITDAESNTSFVISVYSLEQGDDNLNDSQLWGLKLNDSQRPKSIKTLNEKSRLRPFFSQVSNWSKDYLVSFDSSASNEYTPLKLTFFNQDGKINLQW